ncbi:MAG: hypothetical protein ACK5LV_00365 [Lachnospirales bacterium]
MSGLDKFKKYSDRIVKSSFIFIIVSGIVLNIFTFISGRGTSGIDIIVVTCLFLGFYLFSEKFFKEYFYFVPSAFYYIAIIFAFFATYLGSYLNFYEMFELWDDALHFISGILLGVLCIILMSFVVIKRFGMVHKKLDILFMVVVGVLVSISIAVFWEFYEYTYDFITDGNMQRSLIILDPANFDPTPYMRASGRFMDPGLQDTMGDFLQAVSGAIIAGIYCFSHYAFLSKNIDEYTIELKDKPEEIPLEVDVEFNRNA